MRSLEEMNPVLRMLREQEKRSTTAEIGDHECMQCSSATWISDDELLDLSKASQSNYFCVFSRIPNLVYYLQSFSLPAATNRKIQIGMPRDSASYYVAGHSADYEEFTMNFIMDENFISYFRVAKWMREIETKDNFDETVSWCSLMILNNAKKPIIRVDFRDVFPSSIGDIQFSNLNADPIMWYATFSNYSYSVKYLDGSLSIPFYNKI